MKILMLTPYLPYPPASGGQIRTLNLLKYLSKHNEITLVSLYKYEQEKQYTSYLKSYCREVYLCKRAERPWQLNIIARALLTPEPLLISRNFSKEATIVLRSLLQKEKFDVIHAETFYIMPHLPRTSIPILLVEQTIEYKVYQHFVSKLPFFIRPFFYPDTVKLKFWERFYWKKAAVVATVSQFDNNTIEKIEPQIDPVTIPNGAGDEMFVEKLLPKIINPPTLLFIGNFFWLQNTEAAEYLIYKIYPKIKKVIPNIKVIVAGQQAKAKLAKVTDPEVNIIDISPDDTETVLRLYKEASLFIAPIFGPGGTRLKILAAMASGLPIIATQTGTEGLSIEDNKHALIAKSPEEFVDKIKQLLVDKKLYEQLRNNSYELAKKHFSWNAIAEKLEVVYKSITKIN